MNSYFESIAKNFIEVIKKSPVFKANKEFMIMDRSLLETSFNNKIEATIGLTEAKGVKVLPRETVRTDALQEHYYYTGASKIKKNGMHKFGIAIDILCLGDDEKLIQDGSANEYSVLRKSALECDLHLLGLWDAGHIQAIPVAEQNAMRQYVLNYRAKEYIILAYGSENHYVMALKRALGGLGYAVNYDSYFFGEQTDESVRMLQSDNKLTIDGIVGKETTEFLKSKGYDITKM